MLFFGTVLAVSILILGIRWIQHLDNDATVSARKIGESSVSYEEKVQSTIDKIKKSHEDKKYITID